MMPSTEQVDIWSETMSGTLGLHTTGNKHYENPGEGGGMIGHLVGKPLSDDKSRRSGRLVDGYISLAPVFPAAPLDLSLAPWSEFPR